MRAFFARCWAGDRDQLVLWWPIAFACGIGLYFALPAEPPRQAAVAAALLALAAAWGLRSLDGAPRIAAAVLMGVAAGFAVATARAALVDAPAVARERAFSIVAAVESVAARGERRVALTLAPDEFGRLAPEETPRRVRVTVSTTTAAEVRAGMRIRLRAVLMPPPEPVAPGAFDFARNAWFQGLGGVGFAISRIEILPGEPESLRKRLDAGLERVRRAVALRILDAAPGPGGAISAALLTGERGAIPEDVLEEMRDSGLAHLLSISGLHMALVCGAVFFAVRLALAVVPWLGLRITAKKWAAGAALAVAFGYYLLAGGSVATERSFIMAAISLVAVMLDRPAITMRNVAIAATLTLAARPESLLQAGFQMSFGAVTALVAFYDAMRVWRRDRSEFRGPRSLFRSAALWLAAASATTIVATLATGPMAAHHFNRAAVFGVVANLVAIPLTGAVIMPLGLVGLAAMPFGLETVPLRIMGLATDVIIYVAGEVASWPGAVDLVPATPPASLGLFAFGGIWICLWREAWRWLGLVPIAAAVLLGAAAERPDLIVGRDGENLALRAADGRLAVPLAGRADYSVETWLRRDGDARTPDEAAGGPFACDLEACVATAAGGVNVAFVLERSAIAEECWRADILVARVPVTIRCPAPRLVIDLFDLIRDGAHAVRFAADGSLEVTTSAEIRGDRPWAARR